MAHLHWMKMAMYINKYGIGKSSFDWRMRNEGSKERERERALRGRPRVCED